ncbi:AAA family ATPase [Rhizobium brockwellii]|uniref:AAA family ATPase n=1 Tax=Rhizobium brockwellii TaxID=3019932 RepID=UPI003F961C36
MTHDSGQRFDMLPETAALPVVPSSIWQELEKWSAGLANWQKLLIATAVRNGVIPDAVIDQTYRIFLAEHDLAQKPDIAFEIPSSITGRDHAGTNRRRLHRIHTPIGVNRLPSTAELIFADGLTVIYGGNGVGKSGFARILSNACFSRQQHPIYPDVFDENAPTTSTALLDLIDEKGKIATLTFDANSEHSELKRGFVVFDSAVALRHLTDAGPFGFTPTGFDVFPEMARAYTVLQTKLAADIQSRRRDNALANAFIGPETAASKVATKLSNTTDLDNLRALATFGADQAARIEHLQSQSDQLRVKAPDVAIKRLSDSRPQLVLLKESLAEARTSLSEEMLESDVRLRQSLVAAASEFARASATQFQHEKVAGIGTQAWESMIGGLEQLRSQQHEHYPSEGDVCLLCQQPLGEDARKLFELYADFSSGDSKAALQVAERNVHTRRQQIERISLVLADEGSVAHNFLAETHPAVLTAITEGVAHIKTLQSSVLAAFSGTGSNVVAVALADFGDVLDGVIETIDQDLLRLRQSDVPSALAAIDMERVELRHREVLSQNLEAAVSYVRDLKWIARAEATARPALNPRHLTEKQGELFSSVIAKNYRDGLAKECKALACNVPVQLRTQGRQGQTIRSLAVANRPPDDILSEGEQRAVALADFLTEVGLNDDNVGVILDDPVTSLDHERKELIAKRLVAAAGARQVVVFTHDMVFFAKLADAADKAKSTITTHWMQRSGDNKPGMVSLNDGPTTTPQYRKTDFAEQTLAKAKAVSGSAQEALVRQGAGQLRRTVEEVVPQYLFKEVVRRWTDRVMITALKKINWDNGLADEIVEIFEACSAIMEGHSHTEAGTEAPPTPEKLEELIVRTKELIRLAKVARA